MKVPNDVQDQINNAVRLVTDHDYADAVVVNAEGEVQQGHARLMQALDLKEQGFQITIPIVVRSGDDIAVIQL